MSNSKGIISIVGHTAVDHLMRVPSFPAQNHSALISERHTDFGGGAANIAAGIVRLGEPCTLISAVGSDFFGSEYDRWMTTLGIQRQFFIRSDLPTPAAFVFTDLAGNQITYFDWGASQAFSEEEAPALPFVHLATADPGFNLRVAEKSTFSSFVPGQDLHRYTKEQLAGMLEHIDILFANHHEVEGMCRILHLRKEQIVESVPVVIITRGAEGSVLHEGGITERIPAIPVQMVDPTGAGDSYQAGFLTAYVRGYSTLDCCRVGAVTASFVVEHRGGQTHLPTWDEVMQRYRTNFREIPNAASRRF